MPPPHYRQRPAADWDSHHLGDTMERRHLGGAGGSRSRATVFDWDSRHLGGDLKSLRTLKTLTSFTTLMTLTTLKSLTPLIRYAPTHAPPLRQRHLHLEEPVGGVGWRLPRRIRQIRLAEVVRVAQF